MIETIVKVSHIISNRLDVDFYKEINFYEGFVSLSDYVTVKGGKRIPKGKNFSSCKTDYLYLRLGDIADINEVDYFVLKCIDEELFRQLQRYEIGNNSIVISIAGTIGKVILLKEIPKDKRIILTENCAQLVLKTDNVLPEYLKILLELPHIQEQITKNRIKTTIPKIGLDRIGKLQIPLIPNKDIQQEIVNRYNEAYQDKKFNVEKILTIENQIYNFLLEELKFNKYDKTEKLNYDILKVSEVVGRQFDVKSNMSKSESFITDIGEVLLSSIAHVYKGKSITKNKVVSGNYPVIAGGQTSPYSHSEYNENADVITISASGAYAGYVWYHDYKIFASDSSVVRSKDESKFLTYYIYLVLKLKQEYIYKLQKGSGQPHVYPKDIAKISIPNIDINTQTKIVKYVKDKMQQINFLNNKANNEFEESKKQIEKMIIG